MSKPSKESIDKNKKRKEKFLAFVEELKGEGESLTVNQKAQLDFWESDQTIPTCVNHGCDNLIQTRNWGNVSQKSECNRCMADRKAGKTRKGVTTLKKRFCENIDSHWGFKCPFLPDVWPDFQPGLHLDHIDGDHYNNHPNNVETLCCVCHARKSNEKGDVNSNKPAGRKLA